MSFLQPQPALPLGSLIQTVAAACGLADKSPWPVWSGSTRKAVTYQPLPKRQAVRLWHDARRFERQTRNSGHQDGALGRNGLAVLYALLFDFLRHATGRLDPTRKTIAKAANICVRSVDKGLAALRAAGVLNWLRRCTAAWEDGIYRLRQIASAYFVLPQGQWRGFWRAPEVPAPYPDAWGATPPLPEPIAAAAALHAEGASREAQLEAMKADPRDPLAASLARLFAGMDSRKR